jgi:hypothetical protein
LTGPEKLNPYCRPRATVGSIQHMCRQLSHYESSPPNSIVDYQLYSKLTTESISVWSVEAIAI